MQNENEPVLDVHIWTIDVIPGPDSVDPGKTEILSGQELEQAGRFRFVRDAQRFLFRRRALRNILSDYFQKWPKDLDFLTSENGKPRVSCSGDENVPWEFNFSHSRDVAMLALVRGIDVGIDVEYILKPMPDMYEVLKVVCSGAEFRQFLTLPEPWHQKAFFKLWTTKEAYLKALGTGLSREPDTVHLKIHREGDDVVMMFNNAEETDWQFITFEPRQGYLATLALRTERKIKISRFSFSREKFSAE